MFRFYFQGGVSSGMILGPEGEAKAQKYGKVT